MQNGWNDDSGVDAGVCATPAPAEGETSFSFRAYTLAGLWVLCLWGAKCLFVAWIPLRKLALTPWLIDDSFIFMRIARNLAEGKGYSFDGVHATTGAPPTWTLLTSLNHHSLGLEAAAKLTVMESAFFGALSTFLVFHLTRRLFGPKVSWWALFLVSFLPIPFFNALNGMETSLFTSLGLLSIAIFLQLDRQAFLRRPWRFFFLGILLGVCCTVRFDALFLVVAVGVVIGIRLFQERRSGQGPAAISHGLALGAGLLVPLLPLLCWGLWVTGSVFPSNQAGRRFLAWQSIMTPEGRCDWHKYWATVDDYAGMLHELISVSTGAALLALMMLCIGMCLKRTRAFSMLTLVYFVSYALALVFYQRYFPGAHGLRYLDLFTHLAVVTMVGFVLHLVSTLPAELSFLRGDAGLRRLPLALLLGLVIACSGLQYKFLVGNRMTWVPHQGILPLIDDATVDASWGMTDWINENLPEGTPVAAKDHGKLAYFTQARVVDLSGVLEPALVKHLREGTIGDYLNDQGTEYFVDGYYPVHHAVEQACVMEKVWTPSTKGRWNPSLCRILVRDRSIPSKTTKRIDFSALESGMFLEEGWGKREHDGRWSVAEEAVFDFDIEGTGPVTVRLCAKTYGKQKVLVRVNETEPVPLEFDAAKYSECNLDLTKEQLEKQNRLVFLLPECRSPASLGKGTDTRALGIRVAWIEVANECYDQ